MIVHLPVRRTTVRIDGTNQQLLEVVPGHALVKTEGSDSLSAHHGELVEISNPLIEAMISWMNTGRGEVTASAANAAGATGLNVAEKLYIVLVDPNFSNEGQGESNTRQDVHFHNVVV